MPDSSVSLSVCRQVPAWRVQTGSYSLEDYVFVFSGEIAPDGWPRTKLVHRLTPVDAAEQDRLRGIAPIWLKSVLAEGEVWNV